MIHSLKISALIVCLASATAMGQPGYPSTVHQEGKGMRITQEEPDTPEIRQMLHIVGHLGDPHPDSALAMLEQILHASRHRHYSFGIAKSLQLSGIVYSHTGRFAQGIEHLRQLIYYCLTSGEHKDLLALGYNILGNIYLTQGKYEEAAYYYHQALLMPREHIRPSTVALIYINLSRLTQKLKQPPKALSYLDRAEPIATANRNYDLLCTINTNRGMIYAENDQTDSAIFYLHKAKDLILEYSNRYQNLQDIEYTNLVYLADLWLQEGQLDSAGACIKRIHEIKTPVVPLYWNRAYLISGKFYLQSRDYKRAEYYLIKALDSMTITNANNDLPNIHQALSDLYSAKEDFRKALQHNKNYIRLKDSLENERITNNVLRLEVLYRTSEKDKELIQQKMEITRQQSDVREKNLWIAIITSGMIVLVIVSAGLYKKRQTDRRLQLKEIQILRHQQETMEQAQEIERLKAMMKGEERERSRLARELHDGIGGMITAIKMSLGAARRVEPGLAQSQSLKEITRMLKDTGAEIRKTAHNLMPDVLVRNSLPEALMIFCTNIHQQLPTELSCQGDFSQLDKATELMLYRMTQELVQNILKHASATRASIELVVHENKLILTVEDNGTGFDTSRESSGFGLQNLRYRVAALQGNISIISEKNQGTIIHIEFELEKLRLGA
jgi:signal transduction histidine kinase/Tfp pilus assembly protein PilF